MKNMRNIYVYKNHPHFCPRKNGDSCRPVSGFHRLKRELHTRIVIPISPPGLLRLFPCSLRVPLLSFPSGFARSSSFRAPLGRHFSRFPVPISYRFLAVFHPLGCRFPPFPRFPVRFPPCRGVPCGCALSLSACSRLVALVSVFVPLGGEVLPVL